MNNPLEIMVTALNKPLVKLSSGKEVEVKRISPRTVKSVTQFVQKIFLTLREESEKNKGPKEFDFLDPAVILHLIAINTDDLYDLAVELSSLEKEEFLDLPLDDAVAVIAAIILENKRFFTERISPLLEQLQNV